MGLRNLKIPIIIVLAMLGGAWGYSKINKTNMDNSPPGGIILGGDKIQFATGESASEWNRKIKEENIRKGREKSEAFAAREKARLYEKRAQSDNIRLMFSFLSQPDISQFIAAKTAMVWAGDEYRVCYSDLGEDSIKVVYFGFGSDQYILSKFASLRETEAGSYFPLDTTYHAGNFNFNYLKIDLYNWSTAATGAPVLNIYAASSDDSDEKRHFQDVSVECETRIKQSN